MQEAVASIVFYLFTIPNAFVVVKTGISNQIDNHNYFSTDIFGLYNHEYIRSSQYAEKNKYGGAFVWSNGSGEWTQENYELWKQKFVRIFKPTDIRLHIHFENREGLPMIDFLMRLFNVWFRQNRGSEKVTLTDFETVEDLRE